MIHTDPTVLRGVAVAVKAADREVRQAITKATRDQVAPVWQQALAQRVARGGEQAKRVFGPGRMAGGNPPALTAATSSRPLSGGLYPSDEWPWIEFGSAGDHGRRGQLPNRYRKGQFAYAAAASTLERAAGMWTDAVFEAYATLGEVTRSG